MTILRPVVRKAVVIGSLSVRVVLEDNVDVVVLVCGLDKSHVEVRLGWVVPETREGDG